MSCLIEIRDNMMGCCAFDSHLYFYKELPIIEIYLMKLFALFVAETKPKTLYLGSNIYEILNLDNFNGIPITVTRVSTKENLSKECVAAMQELLHISCLPKLQFLKGILYVDEHQLKIFFKESLSNYSHKMRENSLFSMFECQSKMGQKLLRSWFGLVFNDLELIKQRQQQVHLMMDRDLNQFKKHLQLNNIVTLLDRIRKKQSHNDWLAIEEFIASLQYFSNQKLIKLDPQITQIHYNIVTTIDLSATKREQKIIVQPDINIELDKTRMLYKGLDQLLSSHADQINLQCDATAFKLVYFPQLGFLIALEGSSSQYQPDLDFQFHAEGLYYYKNPDMRKLDEEIGDIYCIISDIELQIIQSLTFQVLQNYDLLIELAWQLAEIDCFVALASVAISNRYCKPVLTDSNEMYIQSARHPLIEQSVDYISNDYTEKQLIITGSNSSGKTSYLSSIALIIYLAHIGSFVPATSATISKTNRIICRIQGNSFSSDLHQIAQCIQAPAHETIVLLDEFGRGTTANDGKAHIDLGIALFAATVAELIKKQTRFIASTHYYEVFGVVAFKDVKFMTMKIMLIDNNVAFLHKLVPGVCQDSLGILCAKNAGVSQIIIERAMNLKEAIINGEPFPIPAEQNEKVQVVEQLFDLFLGGENTEKLRKLLVLFKKL